MIEHNWCTECSRSGYGSNCRKCNTELEMPPATVVARRVFAMTFVGILAIVFLLGPPAAALVRALQGGPLFHAEKVTRTTTETMYSGILPDIAALLIPWAVLMLIVIAVSSGVVPRRI